MKNKIRYLITAVMSAVCFFSVIHVSANEQTDISVYGQQEEITYTVNITLPEVEAEDVPFTVYAEADNKKFSKQGVIKKGEKTTVFKFENLPPARKYKTSIEFDYHKYQNAVLEDFLFWNIAYAKDFETDFTAEYSRSVVFDISLPNDFVPQDDIEVKVQLSKYTADNVLYVVDSLTDWTDGKTVTLNAENRSEEVCLYTQTSEARLSYKLLGNYDGLCEKGYLSSGGKTTSDKILSKKITEDLTAELQILKKKEITVKVYRPFFLTDDNDIFATVVFDDISSSGDITMDFTQTPLIAAGEAKSQFTFEIAEDKAYRLMLSDIKGDDRLLDYYYYVKPGSSPSESGEERIIGHSVGNVSLRLLKCSNVSVTIDCEKQDSYFYISAVCELDNGNTVEIYTEGNGGTLNLKIPEDTNYYTLDVQTYIGVKSYYVSDGISTNDYDEATAIDYEDDTDKEVVLKYIVQNPTLPIDIFEHKTGDYFVCENISDYLIDEFDAYVAYYDKNGKLISLDIENGKNLVSGFTYKLMSNTDNYKIKKAKAFVWKKDGLTPISETAEMNVNQPNIPEQIMSVFTVGDGRATINCEEMTLSLPPALINDAVYISAPDFEMMGYKVREKGGGAVITDNYTKYAFTFGEYTAVETSEDTEIDISAPILYDGEILVPVAVISELFGKKTDYYAGEKTLVVNMPFCDIAYGDVFEKAIIEIYNRGIMQGYEDGSFKPDCLISRSEAALFFARAMGHDFANYEFECSDVSDDNWAKSWVGICINEKVFDLENGKFRPNDNLTFEEAVTAVLKMKGESFENPFETAEKSGLLTGFETENFDGDITRAEFALLLYNF